MGKRLFLIVLLLNILPVIYKNTFLGVHSAWAGDGFADESGGEDDGGSDGGGTGGDDGCDDPSVLVSSGTDYELQGDQIYMIETDIWSDPCSGSTYENQTATYVGDLPTISLSVSSSQCSPGEQLTLAATPSNTVCYNGAMYDFQGSFGSTNVYYSLGDGPQISASFQYRMRVLGTVHFRVVVTYSCAGQPQNATSGDDISTASGYCASDLSNDAGGDMNAAWNSMITATNASQGTKFEYGFYRIFDGSALVTNDQTFTNNVPCGTLENLTADTYNVPGGANPATGDTWWIGKFHVHPSLRYCGTNECLPPGPSTVDLGSTVDFPAIVRTYSAQVCGGVTPTVATADAAYGTSCTTYH